MVCKNRDLDASHPAGTLIDDLMMVWTLSYAKYVQNNYTGDEYVTIDKPVSELREGDLTMIKSWLHLYFAKPVQTGIDYKMEVTLETTEGMSYVLTGVFHPEIPED